MRRYGSRALDQMSKALTDMSVPTLRPKAEAVITTQKGRNISGAELNFISGRFVAKPLGVHSCRRNRW
jgi:hypothetical protein